MLEKQNVLEVERTVCDFCGNLARVIDRDGVARCLEHYQNTEKTAACAAGKIPETLYSVDCPDQFPPE